jgi:Co/Zn/Cd efflux system component
MSGCCGHNHTITKDRFHGASATFRRTLWLVIALNAILFGVEICYGVLADSQALQADAMDFLGDTLTYGISLYVIGRSVGVRTSAALMKSISLAAMGIYVLASTMWRVFILALPSATVMGWVGLAALAANIASVLLLYRFKDGDANVKSVWLCSRNDAIGNVAVMLAAVGVWGSQTAWPDLAVAAIMASLFLSSAVQITRQAITEYRNHATSS